MHALEVVGLTKRYGRSRAVEDVGFAVEPGSVHGLVGPNGSGKTTTLGCLLGLWRPDTGRISVLGLEPHELSRSRGRVGVVFDSPILVRGLTVRQQLRYARALFGHAGGRSDAEVLELAGLAHQTHQPVTGLSLGQEKRLAVATALAGKPELLVLDEPLSGLDPLGVRDFLKLLTRLAGEGTTILLSSHRLHEIEPVLTHATVLLEGRVARTGELDGLLGAGERYRLSVDDEERARTTLEAFDGTRLGSDSRGLRLELGPHAPATLNRALVEAGVAVSELRRETTDLATLFDDLVEEHARRREARASAS